MVLTLYPFIYFNQQLEDVPIGSLLMDLLEVFLEFRLAQAQIQELSNLPLLLQKLSNKFGYYVPVVVYGRQPLYLVLETVLQTVYPKFVILDFSLLVLYRLSVSLYLLLQLLVLLLKGDQLFQQVLHVILRGVPVVLLILKPCPKETNLLLHSRYHVLVSLVHLVLVELLEVFYLFINVFNKLLCLLVDA